MPAMQFIYGIFDAVTDLAQLARDCEEHTVLDVAGVPAERVLSFIVQRAEHLHEPRGVTLLLQRHLELQRDGVHKTRRGVEVMDPTVPAGLRRRESRVNGVRRRLD